MRKISPTLFAAAFLSASIPTANAQLPVGYLSHLTIGGDSCNTRSPDARDVRRIDGSLVNVSETHSINVSCPIPATTLRPEAQLGNSFQPTVDISVYVTFLNAGSEERELSCRFTLGKSPAGTARTVLPAESSEGLSFTFVDVYSDKVLFNPLTVSCPLPPLTEIVSLNVFQAQFDFGG